MKNKVTVLIGVLGVVCFTLISFSVAEKEVQNDCDVCYHESKSYSVGKTLCMTGPLDAGQVKVAANMLHKCEPGGKWKVFKDSEGDIYRCE